jgi:hypothetical protein
MKHAKALLLVALQVLAASAPSSLAEVVRPAPELAFPAYGGKTRSLASFKGQPVIILLADSHSRGSFKAQLRELDASFDRLAIRGTVIAAGFKKGNPEVANTNIPLILLPDGAAACAAFRTKNEFTIVLVGPDGNVDYQTSKVLNINRILEVMQNNYEIQKAARKGVGDR